MSSAEAEPVVTEAVAGLDRYRLADVANGQGALEGDRTRPLPRVERITTVDAAHCKGELGVSDMYVGVPTIIGCEGIERVVDIKLTKEEQDMFNSSVESVKSLVSACKEIDSSLK